MEKQNLQREKNKLIKENNQLRKDLNRAYTIISKTPKIMTSIILCSIFMSLMLLLLVSQIKIIKYIVLQFICSC